MSCPSRNTSNWDDLNASFNPTSISTPRGKPSADNEYSSTYTRPQRLYSSGSTPYASNAQYFPNQSAPADYEPEYYPRSQAGPPVQYGRPRDVRDPRSMSPSPKTPIITRKVIYERTNLPPEVPYMQYQQNTPNWSQQAATPQRNITYPVNRNLNKTYGGYTDLSFQSPNQSPARSRSPAPNTSYRRANTAPRGQQQTGTPGTREKPGCQGSCSNGKAKLEKLYNDFVNAMKTTVVSALVRRKRMRSAIDITLKYITDDLDCKERKAQEKALNQLESNFHSEIIAIYNHLMNRRKQLYHEMNNERNSRGSLVSINAPFNKTTNFSIYNHGELKEEEQNIAMEFTKIVGETINEFCMRDIELSEEFSSLAEADADSDSLSAYHQEYMKQTEQMEEDFIGIWEEYEANKCGCSKADQSSDDVGILIESGNVLLETLAKQFKMCEELEKRLREECTSCQSSSTTTRNKNYQHSDRMELNNVHVDVMNDLWYAMEAIKELLESRDGNTSTGPIFRAILAIYRKCHSQVKVMLDSHFDKRRMHQVENLSSIFDDEWSRLRKEMNAELKSIIDAVNYGSATNMTCQERRLKKMQEMEKEQLLNKYKTKYRSERDTSSYARGTSCRETQSDERDSAFNEEMTALEQSHQEQWDTMVEKKLQRKIEDIDRVYPQESKEACVQTCASKKKQNQTLDNIDEVPGKCGCPKLGNDIVDTRETKSDSNVRCTNRKMNGVANIPDLGELTTIEVKEMKELQQNLRQWQLARRHLLESINKGLKQ